MPYTNLPDDPEIQAAMERCVDKVMAQGHDKQAAIAICHTSLTRHKANYGARTGQTIAGNLGRGQGGRFVRAGTGGGAAAGQGAGSGSQALGESGLDKDAYNALNALRTGGQPSADVAKKLIDAGLATRDADGKITSTTAGRSVANAIKRGDVDAVRRAMQKKPGKPAKGPKGGKPKVTPEDRAAARAREQDQNFRDVLLNVADIDDEALQTDFLDFARGGGIDEANGKLLQKMGLLKRNSDDTFSLSGQGRSFVNAALRGDKRRARDALANKKSFDLEMLKGLTMNKKDKRAQRRLMRDMEHKAVLSQQALDDAEDDAEIEEKCGPEMGMTMPQQPYGGALTIADAIAAMDAQEQAEAIGKATWIFQTVTGNILADETVTDKASAISSAAQELQDLINDPEPLMKESPLEYDPEPEIDITEKSEWSTATVNDLPDSSFLFIESGGEKQGGKTTPRSLRHFPYKDAGGKIDLPHLRNAIARIPQSDAPGLDKAALQERARKLLAGENKEYNVDETTVNNKSIIDSLLDGLQSVLDRFKEGRRHSSKDDAMLQTIHDNAYELGAKCMGMTGKESSLSVFKDDDGKLRWVTTSSSAFLDKDKEIVSQKALETDAERMTKENEYGPLRWWHVGGADFGPCDFSATHGKLLIESGTFNDDAVGEALKEGADDLEVSIGFTHPIGEPDKDGVFNTIKIFERSLLPRGRASNLLTGFTVKEAAMLDEKKAALVGKIGAEKAEHILNSATQKEQDALAANTKFKGGEPRKISEMTEADLSDAIGKALAPYVKEVQDMKAQAKTEKDAAAAEQAAREKAVTDRLAGIETSLAAALTGVSELKGELPRQLAYKPSESGRVVGQADAQGNVVEIDPRFKNAIPQRDPLAPFMNALMPGSVQSGG